MVDLDGVICEELPTFQRAMAEPIPGAKEAMVKLCSLYTVVIYTARGWAEKEITEWWLRKYEIPYHGLVMGKPIADIIIDDRAVPFGSWDGMPSALLHGLDVCYETNLYRLRRATAELISQLGVALPVAEPVLEFGPMQKNSPVFERMPETYIDVREHFERLGIFYLSADPFGGADRPWAIEDPDADNTERFGTILALSVLEHLPWASLAAVPMALHRWLRRSGKAYLVTPWDVRLHGPEHDFWRLSEQGLRSLFSGYFTIDAITEIGETIHPAGYITIMTRR